MTGQTLLGVSLKSYFTYEQTLRWTRLLADECRRCEGVADGRVRVVVLPSEPALVEVIDILVDTPVRVGAQDVSVFPAGPHTGETSASMLAEIGCSYAEVGHAERRSEHGETDDVVAAKFAAALRSGLRPLLCVGEADRMAAAEAAEASVEQLHRCLAGAGADASRIGLVVAYEPHWAIGADQPASIEHITVVCQALTDALPDLLPAAPGYVLYGGSAGPGLLTQLGDAVSGLFLGRFAHDLGNLRAVLDEASARSHPLPMSPPPRSIGGPDGR